MNFDICCLLILNNGYLLYVLGNGSQKYCLQENFCENMERGAATKKQRTQNWALHSHQDFVTKLQPPYRDPVCHLYNRFHYCTDRQHVLSNDQHTEMKAVAVG